MKKYSFTKNPLYIKELFDSISQDYDKLNDIMSFGIHRCIKQAIVIDLYNKISQKNNLKILDLCTGTGDIAEIIQKKFPTAKIIGIDFSKKMLDIAKQKHANIEFIECDCTNLPIENSSIDACIISFGLRNIENIKTVINEIHRVLKQDGVFINLDLGKPNKFFNIFLKPYMYLWITILGKIFHGNETPYKYLAVSNETFLSPEDLDKTYQKYGFSKSKIRKYLFGQISSQLCKKID